MKSISYGKQGKDCRHAQLDNRLWEHPDMSHSISAKRRIPVPKLRLASMCPSARCRAPSPGCAAARRLSADRCRGCEPPRSLVFALPTDALTSSAARPAACSRNLRTGCAGMSESYSATRTTTLLLARRQHMRIAESAAVEWQMPLPVTSSAQGEASRGWTAHARPEFDRSRRPPPRVLAMRHRP